MGFQGRLDDDGPTPELIALFKKTVWGNKADKEATTTLYGVNGYRDVFHTEEEAGLFARVMYWHREMNGSRSEYPSVWQLVIHENYDAPAEYYEYIKK